MIDAWLIVGLIAGAVLPVVILVGVIMARIRTLPPAEQPEAKRQSVHFGIGVIGGIAGALVVCAVVIGLALVLRGS